MPGGLYSAPAVFTRSASPLIIDVVARGSGGATWHRAYVKDHSLNWEDIHMQGMGTPSIAISPSQHISVWSRGLFPDPSFYRRDYDAGWQIGPAVAAPSSGTSPHRGEPHAIAETETVDLFVIGKSTNVWRSIYFH